MKKETTVKQPDIDFSNKSNEIVIRNIESAPYDGSHIIAFGYHHNDFGERILGFCEIYYFKKMGWYNISGYPFKPILWFNIPINKIDKLLGNDKNQLMTIYIKGIDSDININT